jgi:hypothetical protein
MSLMVLDAIPFRVSLSGLARKLRLPADSPHLPALRAVLAEARKVAAPKAAYRVAYIDSRGEDTLVIEGITFRSRVLRVNTDQAQRVFAYVATCGLELEEWSRAIPRDDMLAAFWADAIKEAAVYGAMRVLRSHILEAFSLKRAASMAPGSLADWPISQQRPLFALLGDVQEAIGVRLTPSMLMVPSKSVSGLLFPTEESFESCQLCPRPGCPNRRAPYDADLYERRFKTTPGT